MKECRKSTASRRHSAAIDMQSKINIGKKPTLRNVLFPTHIERSEGRLPILISNFSISSIARQLFLALIEKGSQSFWKMDFRIQKNLRFIIFKIIWWLDTFVKSYSVSSRGPIPGRQGVLSYSNYGTLSRPHLWNFLSFFKRFQE